MSLSRRDLLKYAAAVPGVLGLSALVTTPAAAKAASATWMADMMPQIGNVALCRVALPGTHDSGTYGMTTQSALDPYNEGARARVVEAVDRLAQQREISARPLLVGWSQAQDLSVGDQLRAGIRYVDLRVSLMDSTYVLGHVLVCGTLQDALQQVLLFTQQYPSELIILDVNHLYGMETIESQVALIDFIAAILAGRLVQGPPALGPSNTVNEILRHDPDGTARVILLFSSAAAIKASGRSDIWCSEAENYPPCESSQIISLWPDQDNATGVLDHIRSQPQRDPDRFYVSQGQITPSDQLISRSSHPGSLREAAKLYNPEVISMAAGEWRATGANIIILDFFEMPSGGLLDFCRHLNGA
ncbi:MAG: hypothetical protein QOH91_1510 [Mycobacterium sp.]|jgi:hypothetical protein|nr:hypothetical protein [Mycobacterium sp.]